MTPSARLQAAIEILDLVIAAARDAGPAADTIVADYFRTRRYAGSGDRRAVRELVYAAIRRSGERPADGRAAILGLAADEPGLLPLFEEGGHGPAPLAKGEAAASAGLSPDWLPPRFSPLIDEAEVAALLTRAPLDLRVNRLKSDLETVAGVLPEARRVGEAALRLPEGFAIERHPAFLDGLVEIQDLGSQAIVEAAGAGPGMTVVDLCAGAGGKTLGLAAAMRGEGRLVACDTDRGRLSRLPERARRSGAGFVETRLLDPGREFAALADLAGVTDIVLVDAPCSGTGTWRRNPESRWRLTLDRLKQLKRLQMKLLDLAALLTAPGGSLTYAVCSLLPEEGAHQFDAFLDRNRGWAAAELAIERGRAEGRGRLLTPLHDDSDGFFIARAVSPC